MFSFPATKIIELQDCKDSELEVNELIVHIMLGDMKRGHTAQFSNCKTVLQEKHHQTRHVRDEFGTTVRHDIFVGVGSNEYNLGICIPCTLNQCTARFFRNDCHIIVCVTYIANSSDMDIDPTAATAVLIHRRRDPVSLRVRATTL
jgi:hypothetical protein